MLDTLRDLARSVRPPSPERSFPVPDSGMVPAVVSMASGRTPDEAVDNVLQLAGTPAAGDVLVLPSIARRPGQGAHPHVIAALLLHFRGRATLAIGSDAPAPIRRRWERLARERETPTVYLGRAGWDEVVLADDAFMLDRVLLPAELQAYSHCIAVPALGDNALALGFLRTISHPHTRLRARGNLERERLDAEVARAANLTYLLDASRLPGSLSMHLACQAPDALSTELVGLSIRRYLDSARGFETSGSWEHRRVQAATEIGFGPQTGADLLLQVRSSDSRLGELVSFVAADLTCQVTWKGEEAIEG